MRSTSESARPPDAERACRQSPAGPSGGRASRAGRCPVALRAVILAASVWVALLLAAPWAASSGDGARPAVRAAALLYLAAGTICHQQEARSFHLAGLQLPVCARCLGLYLGALVGLLSACRLPRGDPGRLLDGTGPRTWWLIVGGAALPGALLWLAEMGGWLPSAWGNPVRLSAGILLGAVGGWVVGLAVAAWSRAR